MIIHFNNTEVEVIENDNSYRYRAIMGEHSLTLHFSMPEFIEIPVGAHCEFQGQTYTLEKPENFKKNGSREFEYTIVMDSAQTKLGKYKLRNTVDRRLKFSYTAKPQEHLQLLVDNLNQRDSGWSVGEYVDSVEKTISYNHTYCNESLQMMADEFNTEWEVVEKTIHLRKVEYNKDNPLPMSYGRGNGFLPGVGRSNYNDSRPVEILFVQGGEKNIDRSKYGSAELLLPRSQKLIYDGRTYITDADGLSIRRFDKPIKFNNEDSLDCAEIYPKRVGGISSVIVVNADKNFYDIVDESIPDNLNFEDCLIDGETMTIIFQSGMLAGKEFEVKYIHEKTTINGVTKVGKRFEIVPQDIDGQTMPNPTFAPRPEDKYAVFNCMLPEAYICDNATQTGASWDMYKEGVKYLYENEDQRFSFTGEMDGIWSKRDWLNIGGKIKLGSYVLFSDNQFQQDGILIRMVGVKDYIHNPYSPIIELSNVTVGGSVSSDLQKITANEVVVEDKYNDALKFTKRRFRDSVETMEMLSNALLENFSSAINPITVQTMSMLVGDESLQFRFVTNKTNPVEVKHNVVYDDSTKILSVPGGLIQHLTLGINTISSEHKAVEYKFWSLPAFNTPPLVEASKQYYLYAKVSIDGDAGTFYLSETAIKMKNGTDYYHLLMGVLNSEFDGARSYASLYGFTEILPGRITTEKVISADGNNFMDFANNAFRIGNNNSYLDWNAYVKNLLGIKNANVQIINSAGKTMVYINGVDGSGQLAGANITWDAAGNIKAKGGTFSDIIIQGSLRNPFVRETDSIVIGGKQSTHDNVVPIASGGGWITAGQIEWGVEQSGRRMCIANYRWGSAITEGQISYSAPSGKYFYEDGITKKSIHLSRECVELMGYGTETQFYGWIVLNRINLGTNARYGRKVNALAQGIVSGYSSGASINCKTFDESTLSVTRLGEGQYRVYFPYTWGLTVENYIVMMTGYGGGLMKPTLLEQGTSSFVVDVSDDASRNDGSFMFQIINLNDWV